MQHTALLRALEFPLHLGLRGADDLRTNAPGLGDSSQNPLSEGAKPKRVLHVSSRRNSSEETHPPFASSAVEMPPLLRAASDPCRGSVILSA